MLFNHDVQQCLTHFQPCGVQPGDAQPGDVQPCDVQPCCSTSEVQPCCSTMRFDHCQQDTIRRCKNGRILFLLPSLYLDRRYEYEKKKLNTLRNGTLYGMFEAHCVRYEQP